MSRGLSRREFLKLGAVALGEAAALSACGQALIALTTATPKRIATGTPFPRPSDFPTPTPPVPEASPTPSINKKVPSPFVAAGLYIGTYGESGGKPITEGAISANQFNAAGHRQNGYSNVPFGNGESRSVTLYLDEKGKETLPAAMMVSQEWLDTSFKAKTQGNRTTGTLPNGKQAEKEGTTWYLIDEKGVRTGETFVTVVPNRKAPGSKFGWPMLVMKGQELYVGLVDAVGNLLDGEGFHPAFQKPKEIAQKQAQYTGDTSLLTGLGVDYDGKMRLRDIQNKIIATVKYIGDADTMFVEWVGESIKTAEFDNNYQAALKKYTAWTSKDVSTLTVDSQMKLDVEGRPVSLVVEKSADGDTPIMITNMNKQVWEPASSRNVPELLFKAKFAFEADIAELGRLPEYKPSYLDILNQFAGAIHNAGPYAPGNIEKYGFSAAQVMVDEANKDSSTLMIYPGLWHMDYPSKLKNASKEQVVGYMQEYAGGIMGVVKKMKQPPVVSIYNEPLAYYAGQQPGWNKSPYEGAYGRDVLVEAYLTYYKAAEKEGLVVGRDVFFVINEAGIYMNNPKTDMFVKELKYTKELIAQRLQKEGKSITANDVSLGVSMQVRADDKNTRDDVYSSNGRLRPPLKGEISSSIKKLKDAGASFVGLTEIGVVAKTPEDRMKTIQLIVDEGLSAGASIIQFEGVLNFSQPDPSVDIRPDVTGFFKQDLTSKTYVPTQAYYQLLRDIVGALKTS